ncbi:FdrA protein [Sporomusaceae bacterium BoRhaA]|uniref:acyl-CoA synthetase FdrA n=1 Tax=Pelorhabdus rhamnosifermentans TaxID=2772457 RepID=UPI001C061795|nr:acyl-CoA synthetase FdrA [Pelorhabdus rhamnosifermentans]MBU2702483.1 FdrA protein [Pelorhabdus rhamnosifermentans]
MKIYNVVRKNNYYDSVTLMLISKQLKQVEGLDDVSVMMGTPANRVILQEANLLGSDGEDAGPNDLILAFRAPEDIDVQWVIGKIDEQMGKKVAGGKNADEIIIRSAVKAYQDDPEINLAFISVPGEYAAIEAERALKYGKNVFLFSDNVSIEEEAQLKAQAVQKGLLVMGPDCGTAIIGGIGIGFANKVKSGNVGLISASGTGLQEVICLLDAMEVGISQAIGTGGRDLKEAIGATTMLQALNMLIQDNHTQTIVLISKPPAKSVVDKIISKLSETSKKVVLCFLGAAIDHAPANVTAVATLEEAALKTADLSGRKPALLATETKITDWARAAREKLATGQKYVRALYAGGTLCYETMLVLGETLGPIYSNIPLRKELLTMDVLVAGQHTAIDLGDDHFTMGKPHPMIDGSLRDEHILKVAGDPQTAVLLLDVVIGYGAADDPVGELVPVLEEAKKAAAAHGNTLAIVAYVCGTNQDEQNKAAQIAKLQQAGVVVTTTNAQAARLARMIVAGRNS